jgi:hypothetical protein
MLYVILLVFAFVFAIIAALVRVREPAAVPSMLGYVHWGWLSFAFYLAALIFGPGGPITHLGRVGGAALATWIG